MAQGTTTHVVNQVGFTFDPASITVNPGDTIEWHWASSSHTVTSGTPCTADGLFFDSPLTSAAPLFSYVVPDDGTTFIPYFCRPHCGIGMQGTITISQQVGACCDGNTGFCTDDVLPGDCLGNQQDWFKDTLCGAIVCDQHTGACCDGLSGSCMDEVLPQDCQGEKQEWYKGQACQDVACVAIPTVSEWGLVVMTLLILTAATAVLKRRGQLA